MWPVTLSAPERPQRSGSGIGGSQLASLVELTKAQAASRHEDCRRVSRGLACGWSLGAASGRTQGSSFGGLCCPPPRLYRELLPRFC